MSHTSSTDRASSADLNVEPLFKAVLTPNQSLSRSGFLIFMAAIGLLSFAIGLAFWWIGAWPVLGFFGLDLALIYLAFRLNFRAGRAAEMIEITPRELILTRYEPSGRTSRTDFNAYWVRVRLDELPGGRTVLRLASHGRSVICGSFLTDDERRDFAEVLAGELIAARTRSAT